MVRSSLTRDRLMKCNHAVQLPTCNYLVRLFSSDTDIACRHHLTALTIGCLLSADHSHIDAAFR